MRTRILLAYSLPHLPAVLLLAPVNVVQGIYVKYFGLSLSAVAGVLLFARIFDAITDPLIGYLSDRRRARTGSRKPFMIAGGLIFVSGGYFLYAPPADAGALYFVCSFVVFYTGWTLLEIPHVAWGGELAVTSIEKTKIFSYRTAVGYLGLLAFYAVPLLPFFATAEITPETLRWSAIAAGALMLPALYIAMTQVPDGRAPIEARESQSSEQSHSIGSWLKLLGKNRPFLILMAAFLSVYIGAGMWYGLIFIYVDAYLGLGAQFAQMFMLSFALGIACTPLWYRLAKWLGRKTAWGVATALMIVSYAYTDWLQPGTTSFEQLVFLKSVNSVAFVALTMLIPAVLSDVVDYGTWKFGVNCAGSYFAIYTLSLKAVNAIGAALALTIVGWFGFDPMAAAQTKQAMFGMSLSIAWLPTVFAVVSFIFLLLIPINARRHDIIRRRLDARATRMRSGAGAGTLPVAALGVSTLSAPPHRAEIR